MPEKQTIEDLKAAQQAHEEELRQKAEQEEAVSAQKAQQKDKAQEDYEPRMDLIAEQEALKQEVKRMEAEKIQERAEETKTLKETEYQKQQELTSSKAELDNLEEELRQVQELVAGKKEDEIAVPVKEALKELSKQIPEAKRKHLEISSILEGVRSGQVSEEELIKYRESKDKIAELEAKILEMESNPEMVEMMMAEAKEEWKGRKEIVDEVFRFNRAFGNEEQKKALEQLTQEFIDEEISALGINKIRNTEERQKAEKDTMKHLALGIKFKYGDIKTDNDYQEAGQRAGDALKYLTDSHWNTDNTINALLREMPAGKVYKSQDDYNKDTEGKRKRMNSAIERHLGTLNLMRAYDSGMKEYKKDIAPGSDGRDRLGQLATEISYKSDFSAYHEAPILPKDAAPGQKKEIEEIFLKNKKKAEVLEEKLRGDEIQQLAGEIERATQELADMQRQISEAIVAEKIVEGEEGSGRARPKFDELIGNKEKEIKNLNDDLEGSKRELAGLGVFSFSEKKRYGLRIEHDEREIPRSERDLAEIKQRKEAYENANKLLKKSLGQGGGWGRGGTYERFATSQELGLDKAKIQKWLEDKKKRLEGLQKSGEKK